MTQEKIIIYQTDDGQTQVDVKLERDTVWLNRHQLSQLFARDIKPSVNTSIMCLKKVNCQKMKVVANFATTARDGKLIR